LSTIENNNRVEQAFNEFNDSWLTYWSVYIDLQNILYESLKLARDVAWLGATTPEKLSQINAAQRQLFASMPRRLDYAPLGQVNRSMEDASRKIDELQRTLLSEKEKCKRLEDAIDILLEKANRTKQELKI
jgi:hypothetical protein